MNKDVAVGEDRDGDSFFNGSYLVPICEALECYPLDEFASDEGKALRTLL